MLGPVILALALLQLIVGLAEVVFTSHCLSTSNPMGWSADNAACLGVGLFGRWLMDGLVASMACVYICGGNTESKGQLVKISLGALCISLGFTGLTLLGHSVMKGLPVSVFSLAYGVLAGLLGAGMYFIIKREAVEDATRKSFVCGVPKSDDTPAVTGPTRGSCSYAYTFVSKAEKPGGPTVLMTEKSDFEGIRDTFLLVNFIRFSVLAALSALIDTSSSIAAVGGSAGLLLLVSVFVGDGMGLFTFLLFGLTPEVDAGILGILRDFEHQCGTKINENMNPAQRMMQTIASTLWKQHHEEVQDHGHQPSLHSRAANESQSRARCAHDEDDTLAA